MLEGKYIFKLIVIAHIKTGDISDEYISKGLRVAINISNFIYLFVLFHQESRMESYENRISWEDTNSFQSLGDSEISHLIYCHAGYKSEMTEYLN